MIMVISKEVLTSQHLKKNIIIALKSVKAKRKYLTIEQGPLTYWAAQVARPYVDQVIPCDPRANALIYKNPYKKDKVDTKNLCRLLRLGELHHDSTGLVLSIHTFESFPDIQKDYGHIGLKGRVPIQGVSLSFTDRRLDALLRLSRQPDPPY